MGDSIIYCEQCENRVGCHLARQCHRVEEQVTGPLDATACSVIRVRYRVDVQSVSGRWGNVEIRDDESIARRDEAEWRSWMSENRKTWKDIRIVKETMTAEVLQNDTAHSQKGRERGPDNTQD